MTEMTPDDVREKQLGLARHNHVTRDIREPGECPACDAYHERQAAIIGPSYLRSAQVRQWVDEFAVWMRARETWLPQEDDVPFWDRLGIHGDLPAHLPIGVNELGQGPVEPDPAHHYECWCGNVDCPLTIALQRAWLAGRRSAGSDPSDEPMS